HKEIIFTLAADLASPPAALAPFNPELQGPRRLTLHYHPSRTQMGEILSAVQDAHLQIADLSTLETDLEDIFLQLTRAAREATARQDPRR
ncbi:MAG: ABC transporter ATP-binding protein, partial [Dongiaceae bacterium]